MKCFCLLSELAAAPRCRPASPTGSSRGPDPSWPRILSSARRPSVSTPLPPAAAGGRECARREGAHATQLLGPRRGVQPGPRDLGVDRGDGACRAAIPDGADQRRGAAATPATPQPAATASLLPLAARGARPWSFAAGGGLRGRRGAQGAIVAAASVPSLASRVHATVVMRSQPQGRVPAWAGQAEQRGYDNPSSPPRINMIIYSELQWQQFCWPFYKAT